MQSNETQEIFTIFSKVFKRRKWLILFSLLAVIVPIVLYNQLAAPVYEASTMLVFEELSNTVGGYEYEFSREVFFSNQMEEITSYSFNHDLLKALPEDISKKFYKPDPDTGELRTTEEIVAKMQKKITGFPIRNSNIVRISFQSGDPRTSMIVANTAADVLIRRNIDVKREGVGGVREFIEKQLTRYKEQLENSETELRRFKEENRITSVDREAEEVMRRTTEAEVLYNTVQTDIGSVEERLVALKNKLAEQKSDLIPSITDIGSPWAQKLREKLLDFNDQYTNLRIQGYPENHPKLLELQEDMDNIRKDLTQKALELAQGQSTTNPIAQIEKFVDETVSLQIELESLKAREKSLRKVIEGYNHKLGSLPSKEFTLAKLTRERDVSRKIYLMLLEKHEEAKISEAEQSQNIRIIDRAQLPTKPISPRKGLNLVVGILLGLLMGAGIAFVVEVRNNTLDSPDEVESITQWPVIAAVPNINAYSRAKFRRTGYFMQNRDSTNERSYRALISKLEPGTIVAEAYRMLRTNLQFLGVGKEYKTILVTSIAPGDGKTTTLCNLAVAFANFGNKTLIIDSDMRIPRIHSFFGSEREKGVSDLLEALNDLDLVVSNTPDGSVPPTQDLKLAALQSIFQEAVRDSGIKNLSFVSGGKKLGDSNGVVSTISMPIILQKFENKFNVILVDSAPLLLVDDTLVMASLVDAVLLVVHPNKYDEEVLSKAKKLLQHAKANVIGIVLNNFMTEGSYKQYYNSYYVGKQGN